MGIQSRKSTKHKTLAFSTESSSFSSSGGRVRSQQTLNAKGLNDKVTKQNAIARRKREGGLPGYLFMLYVNLHLIVALALDEDEITELRKSWELPGQNSDLEPDNLLHMADVLDGSVPFDGSHAGGEFLQILKEDNQQSERRSVAFIAFDIVENSHIFRQRCRETRTHRDRINQRTEGFRRQMPAIVDAYLLWKAASNAPDSQATCDCPEVDGKIQLQVVDAFGEVCKLYLCTAFLNHSFRDLFNGP